MTFATDTELPEFWEPWSPKIGDRVRIRLSAECQFEYERQYPGARRIYHWPQLDGVIGVIVDPHDEHLTHAPSHRYTVVFDPGVLIEIEPIRHTCLAQCFAAIELEPFNASLDCPTRLYRFQRVDNDAASATSLPGGALDRA